MKTLEHCIYKDANDTRRCEVTMTYGDDNMTHVKEDWSELMDIKHTVRGLVFDDLPLAWRYLDDQYKKFRSKGLRYTALPLEGVA